MKCNILFKDFLASLDLMIKRMIEEEPKRFTSKTTPSDFEKIVVDASWMVICEGTNKADIDYTEGGHAFPDVVIRFDTGEVLGIEVKSSTQAKKRNDDWEILGNSILGSTRVPVDDMYVYFIRVNRNGVFTKYNRYEDSVVDVVVTHSPRYKMNLGIESKNSFFERSGISYKKLKNAENPIGIITEYFREQGETAWWISESVPATIKLWDEITIEQKSEIIAKAFILFPEIVGLGGKKYKRLAKWLVLKYSIVNISMRDSFTAGGQINIEICNKRYKLPKFVEILRKNKERIVEIFSFIDDQELVEAWEISIEEINKLDTVNKKITHWQKLMCNYLEGYEDKNIIKKYIKSIFTEISIP